MEIRTYLKDLIKIQVLIKSKVEMLKVLSSKAEYKGISYGAEVSSNGIGNSSEEILLRIIDKEQELNADIDKYSKMLTESMELIDRLENPQHIQVIYKRYLQNKRWENIAVEMNRDLRQIYRLHGEALVELQKIADKDTKCQ